MTDQVSIYALLDEKRQIRYVGQSKNPEWRAQKHWRERRSVQTMQKNPQLCVWLQAMETPPEHHVFQVVSYEERYRAEEYWTRLLAQVPSVTLLNISAGSRLSDATRKRMSASRQGKQSPMKGKKQSAEARARISDALRGRERGPLTETQKSALREANLGATWNRGRKHTAEARANMSSAHVGKRPGPETRAKMSAARKGVPLSAETRDRMRVAATEQAAIMRWCDRCGKDWSTRVWTRHVRKYHDGGVW